MTLALQQLASTGPLRQGAPHFVHDGRQTIRLPRHVRRGHVCLNALVGIDLGTSNSAVGVVDKAVARIVQTSDGSTTSSLVAFTEVRLTWHSPRCKILIYLLPTGEGALLCVQDKILIGSEARRQAHDNPQNTFSSVKRLIGTGFETSLAELQYAPFKAQPGPNGGTLLCCPARSAQQHTNSTPQDLAPHFSQLSRLHVHLSRFESVHAYMLLCA